MSVGCGGGESVAFGSQEGMHWNGVASPDGGRS